MDKVLIDSSTLFDISRELKGRKAPWSATTLLKLVTYEQQFPRLTVSSMTVFELIEGLYRGGDPTAIANFHQHLLPTYEVIRSDAQIEDKAAEIHAKLRQPGQGIDVQTPSLQLPR